MVRKHYPWTRRRSKRTRPKTPAPKTGWVIAELSRISAVTVRTLRHYVEKGIIRPLELRGTQTRYQRRELLRLLATVRLRGETGGKLADIKRKLDAMSNSELEAWLLEKPIPAAATAALGLAAAVPAPSQQSSSPLPWDTDTPDRASSPNHVETWHHIRLLPGMELRVSVHASEAVKSAAKRICDEYVAR